MRRLRRPALARKGGEKAPLLLRQMQSGGGLPAEGHMASQAVCPCFGMPPPSRKAVAAAFLAARPQTAEAMRQRKIARQKERRAEQRRAQDEEDTYSDWSMVLCAKEKMDPSPGHGP